MKRFGSCLRIVVCILLLQTFVAYSVKAQDSPSDKESGYTLIFKGEPLQHALQRLVEKTQMSLIYDPAVMIDYRVYETAKNLPPEQILRLILSGSGLDFIQLSSGTYVLTTNAQKQIKRGSLTGRVIDSSTGGPLAGASVILANTTGGAVTNKAGYFSIPDLKKGAHEVIITYVGYKPVQDTVWIPANQTTLERFSMAAKPVALRPMVISSIQKRQPAASAFTDQLNQTQLRSSSVSGSMDAVKSLNNVTGINFSLPLADFNIQGGKSHQLLLDGVPIYNPVSMGRLLGAFSPFAIQKITVKKAGYGSPVGSRLSGIVNFHQVTAIDPQNTFLVQANPLHINARIDHKFTFNNGTKISLMVAGRSNIWSWYKKPSLKHMLQDWGRIDPLLSNYLMNVDSSQTYFQPRHQGYNITYYDLHFAARIKHNPFHQTYISAYRGKNKLENSLYSQNVAAFSMPPDLFYSIDRYTWINSMAKISHNWIINAHFNANISGYITHHSLNHQYSITNNDQEDLANTPMAAVDEILQARAVNAINTGDQNAITEMSLQLKLNYNASKNYHLKTGLRLKHLDYKFYLSDRYYQRAQSNATSFLVAGYVQNNFFLSNQASVSIGSRFTFVPSRDLVFAEPRFSFQIDFPGSSAGYFSTKFSGGIYRQFINQFDVSNVGPSTLVPSIRFWVPVDYTTTVPKAYHIAGDLLWQPQESWKIQFETYYKWIPTRLTLDYSDLATFSMEVSDMQHTRQKQFITQAKGYAYGVALSAEKTLMALNLRINGKYGYNISRQSIPTRFDGAWQPVPWSQPHTLSTTVHWNPKPSLSFMLQWKGIWGRTWGFRKAYYDYLSTRRAQSFGSYRFDDPGDDRLPLFAQLNAGISYTFALGKSNMQLRLNAFNLLDHNNVLNWWLLPYHNNSASLSYQKRSRTMPGLSTSLSIKVTF